MIALARIQPVQQTRDCPVCGTSYPLRFKRQLTCSRACGRLLISERLRERGTRRREAAVDADNPLLVSSFRPPALQPRLMVIPTNASELRAMAIAELEPLGLRPRTIAILEHAGMVFMRDLPRTGDTLLRIPNFGAAMLGELKRAEFELRRLMIHRQNGGAAVLEFEPGPYLVEATE